MSLVVEEVSAFKGESNMIDGIVEVYTELELEDLYENVIDSKVKEYEKYLKSSVIGSKQIKVLLLLATLFSIFVSLSLVGGNCLYGSFSYIFMFTCICMLISFFVMYILQCLSIKDKKNDMALDIKRKRGYGCEDYFKFVVSDMYDDIDKQAYKYYKNYKKFKKIQSSVVIYSYISSKGKLKVLCLNGDEVFTVKFNDYFVESNESTSRKLNLTKGGTVKYYR